jgi:hypothetical protein
MKNIKTILIIILLVLIGSLVGFYLGPRWIMPSTPIDVSAKIPETTQEAAPNVLSIAIEAISDYQKTLQWSENLIIRPDAENGVIDTSWYPVHKGEVSEKIQVFVWGENYRIDVWHRAGWSFWYSPSGWSKFNVPYKTEITRMKEFQLQETIEAGLSSRPES